MRKKCKSILCMVLAMVVMFTMTACGGSEKEEKDKSDSTQGSESKTAENGEFSWDMCKGQTIQVLFNEHPYSAAITEHIKDFEELTGIKVQHSTIPETNYFDKVSVLLNSGGDNLDIFMTGPYQIWEYAGAGYMEDLDPFISGSGQNLSGLAGGRFLSDHSGFRPVGRYLRTYHGRRFSVGTSHGL